MQLLEQMAAMQIELLQPLGIPLIFTCGNHDFDPYLYRLLPLPENVIAHFYGHSHIGDAYWGEPACFRKLSMVDGQTIPQFDVAALENIRGDAVRSAEVLVNGELFVNQEPLEPRVLRGGAGADVNFVEET